MVQKKQISKFRIKIGYPLWPHCHIQQKSFSKGQLLVFLLIWLIPLSMGLKILISNLELLHTRQSYLKICRTTSYNAHKHILNGFLKLKTLNPKAFHLRQRLRLAKLKLKLAPTPHQKALALAEISEVRILQYQLHFQQQSIIKNSQKKSWFELKKKSHIIRPKPVPFKFIKRPFSSKSPSYYEPPNISFLQNHKLNWRNNVKSRKKMEGVCGTYIKKIKNRLVIKLSYPDKS